MSLADNLRVGMTFDEVASVLQDWEPSPQRVLLSPVKHVYFTWEFAPLLESEDRIRVTFNRNALINWERLETRRPIHARAIRHPQRIGVYTDDP